MYRAARCRIAACATFIAATAGVGAVQAQRPAVPVAVPVARGVAGIPTPGLPRLTARDVYPNAARVRRASDPCEGHADRCVERGLTALGARPSVIAVARLLQGAFFTEIHSLGVVAIAASENVYAANSGEQIWIVNGTPNLISADLDAAEIQHVLAIAPSVAAQLAPGVDRTKIFPSGDAPRLARVQPIAGRITRYVFRESLVEGCHACRRAGSVEYAFDFDPAGRALQKVFLRFVR